MINPIVREGHQAGVIQLFRAAVRHAMTRFTSSSVLATSLLSLVVLAASSPALQAASRNSFPGRRVGGGTRGECAARPIVHLVPASSVYAPGTSSLIAWLEGPSTNPQPLEVTLRPASEDGRVNQDAKPLLQRQLPAAVNRLVLLTIPASATPLLWESTYRCDADAGADEFGFITASSPPARSLLVQKAEPEDQAVATQLQALQSFCGASTAVAPLKAAFKFDDEVIDATWPQTITVQCF